MSHAVSVFGLGYVGSVTATCLASKGCRVLGVDVDRNKVRMVADGQSPIVEPGMKELISDSVNRGRLSATMEVTPAVGQTDISFLCVGTPSLRNGKLDLGHVRPVCEQIGHAIALKKTFHLVVLRSTVLPGTAESIVVPVLEAASGKKCGSDFGVCVNPEFMREGSAVTDFLQPPITVIGAAEPAHGAMLAELYAWAPGSLFQTSFMAAEMVKYVCNAWHGTKVTFANEIGTLCQRMGLQSEEVMRIFTADTKLNVSAAYLRPGFAFGGSCLPKDLRALVYRAKELDIRLPLLESVLPSNAEHLARATDLILSTGKKKVGVLGLSFKAGTDDLRESPQVSLIKQLIGEGCQVRIWDKDVFLGRLIGSNRQYIQDVIPHIGSLLCANLEDVLAGAEVVIIGTVVPEEELRALLQPQQVVIYLVHPDKLIGAISEFAYQEQAVGQS